MKCECDGGRFPSGGFAQPSVSPAETVLDTHMANASSPFRFQQVRAPVRPTHHLRRPVIVNGTAKLPGGVKQSLRVNYLVWMLELQILKCIKNSGTPAKKLRHTPINQLSIRVMLAPKIHRNLWKFLRICSTLLPPRRRAGKSMAIVTPLKAPPPSFFSRHVKLQRICAETASGTVVAAGYQRGNLQRTTG